MSKKCKKMSKKSDHKHEYELKEIAENEWFTHELICKICGHVGDRLAIYKQFSIEPERVREMIVKELIEKLNKYDGDLKVVYDFQESDLTAHVNIIEVDTSYDDFS